MATGWVSFVYVYHTQTSIPPAQRTHVYTYANTRTPDGIDAEDYYLN